MKAQLVQLGIYSFRLSKAPHPAISQQINVLRLRIEAALTCLLRLRSRTLLLVESNRLQALVNSVVVSYDPSCGFSLNDVVEEAIRADLSFKPEGRFCYIRVGIVSLSELPTIEHSRPMADKEVGRMQDWIMSQVSFPTTEIFERIAFDNENDAFLFEIAYPKDDCTS
ncbi:hypothetical protein KX729_33115 [Rhizobium sp. XQZ8]|uniref:hypothetical protein n=1 Tax=Rhizobium populisoli TaxID=2859785 RepID=UPI001CA4ADF0|nr:hypothetical protein [Rhizobium populisoli]MBW6426189.1 hypothetical protein [Rhizobium populisoli]